MSHVGNGEHDFDDLEGMDLDPAIKESVRHARIEARTIIDFLEPRHITSWADLIGKLEDVLEYTRIREKISIHALCKEKK